MELQKAIRFIHLWLGLISGLVVFILGVTGCIFSLSSELKAWLYKDRLLVKQVGISKISVTKLLATAQTSLGPDYPISRVQIFKDPKKTYQFRAIKIDKDAFGYNGYYPYYYLVYVDPYTGKVVHKENAKWEFFTVSLALHMNLLLGRPLGHFLVRWSVVCFVVLLSSGIVLWWPKNAKRRQLSQALSIKWSGKSKRLNYDLHNVVGFYTFLPLMIIAISGLVMSFELISIAQKPVVSKEADRQLINPSDAVLKDATTRVSQADYYYLNFPVTATGTINVSAYFSATNFYDRQSLKYDQNSAKLISVGDRFSSLTVPNQLKTINYDLHTGSVLGFTGKIIAFLTGLIAASLPVTGLLIWLGRGGLKKKK